MKLAIVGSRKYSNYKTFCKYVERFVDLTEVDLIISGGAIGTDTMAEQLANDHGIDTKIIKPDYNKYKNNPKYAPIARNEIIAKECNVMIAFRNDNSRGTDSAIKFAKDNKKEVIEIDLLQKDY